MKKGFYLKLALTGISKNRKMYFPYILTCVGMVMMFYIICFLSRDPWLASLRGGDTLQLMLGMGTWITGIFAVIFLFYTNSFLIRRRKKEFGLYNMLGMNKRNLARILFWECMVIAGIALAAGMAAGILLSKLGELILSNILDGAVSFSFLVDPKSLTLTAALFGVIFLLILLNGLRQVHFANPRELLESDRVGEKPPKANWVLAVLGVLMLGFAYYLTLTIQDPLVAMVVFFGAVALVILGTYLVFISGSVAFLKLLQKNKRYYYRPNHFVSVSSYDLPDEEERRGPGLHLYPVHHGAGDDLRHSVPVCRGGEEPSQHVSRDLIVETYSLDQNAENTVLAAVEETLESHGIAAETSCSIITWPPPSCRREMRSVSTRKRSIPWRRPRT